MFTKISNLPNFSIVLLIAFFTSFVFLIFATIPIDSEILDVVFSNLFLSFPVITTLAPFSDKIFAAANPIPLLPPVTNATFPDNLISF